MDTTKLASAQSWTNYLSLGYCDKTHGAAKQPQKEAHPSARRIPNCTQLLASITSCFKSCRSYCPSFKSTAPQTSTTPGSQPSKTPVIKQFATMTETPVAFFRTIGERGSLADTLVNIATCARNEAMTASFETDNADVSAYGKYTIVWIASEGTFLAALPIAVAEAVVKIVARTLLFVASSLSPWKKETLNRWYENCNHTNTQVYAGTIAWTQFWANFSVKRELSSTLSIVKNNPIAQYATLLDNPSRLADPDKNLNSEPPSSADNATSLEPSPQPPEPTRSNDSTQPDYNHYDGLSRNVPTEAIQV